MGCSVQRWGPLPCPATDELVDPSAQFIQQGSTVTNIPADISLIPDGLPVPARGSRWKGATRERKPGAKVGDELGLNVLHKSSTCTVLLHLLHGHSQSSRITGLRTPTELQTGGFALYPPFSLSIANAQHWEGSRGTQVALTLGHHKPGLTGFAEVCLGQTKSSKKTPTTQQVCNKQFVHGSNYL